MTSQLGDAMPLRFKKRGRGGMPYASVRGAKALIRRMPPSQTRALSPPRKTVYTVCTVYNSDTRGRKS